jgi:hypothetical protein
MPVRWLKIVPRADLSVSIFPHCKLTVTPILLFVIFCFNVLSKKAQSGVVPSPQRQ